MLNKISNDSNEQMKSF